MSIVTYAGHVKRAKAWYNQSNIFLGIGGQTAWTDETQPPVETADETISDVICLKHVEQKNYVVEDASGTIYYRNKYYRIVDEADIYAEKCRWVFVSCWLNYDEAPVGVSYRKIGCYTDVERNSGVDASKYVLVQNIYKIR